MTAQSDLTSVKTSPKKIAVVLFNLGGPLTPADVRPFLFNLFRDPAILRMPTVPRWLLAQLISRLRAAKARGIYATLGGGSPLLANTKAQAAALQTALENSGQAGQTLWQISIAMRYWKPTTQQAVQEVQAFAPDQIVLLPLYPQFSTTTTASSRTAWQREAVKQALHIPTTTLCCYPTAAGLVNAYAELAVAELLKVPAEHGTPRLLYSAHGLPEKIVQAGDPYAAQVELTAAAITDRIRALQPELLFEPRLCFQSRVGPVKWLEPSTEQEIAKAGQDQTPLVVLPIAFVSDHSETLVELDVEYAHLAAEAGVPFYARVPVVGTHPAFIQALAEQVGLALQAQRASDPMAENLDRVVGPKLCPKGSACACV
jgi:ferrochelatase